MVIAVGGDAEKSINGALGLGSVDDAALYQAIPLRQSTRSLYDGARISKEDRRALRAAAAPDGVSVEIFIERADRADPVHRISVGRSFQRIALQATVLGVRNAHVNQPIEVPRQRDEFARWLGAPDVRPDLIVRFGRAPTLPMSLRL